MFPNGVSDLLTSFDNRMLFIPFQFRNRLLTPFAPAHRLLKAFPKCHQRPVKGTARLFRLLHRSQHFAQSELVAVHGLEEFTFEFTKR
ncbi:MAG: hypothetical protein ACK58T_37490 [Phycisphaerae bacterium]